jgi:hypothetical protein
MASDMTGQVTGTNRPPSLAEVPTALLLCRAGNVVPKGFIALISLACGLSVLIGFFGGIMSPNGILGICWRSSPAGPGWPFSLFQN